MSLGLLAYAQDPFEIQVFEYEPLPLGAYNYEEHLNYVASGARELDAGAATLARQLHASSELTAGITQEARLGAVALTAYVPGSGWQYAGFRVLPQFYAPKSWGLPVNLGLAAEFSFERSLFDQDTRHVELRGIVERHIGRLQMDGNLVFGRALHGPGTRGVEPSARIGWQQWRNLTPSIEYYSALGSLDGLLSLANQTHLVFPGADWKIGDRFTWSFGIGLGTNNGGREIVLKSRLEYELGRKHNSGLASNRSLTSR
ncbi:MAG TPA: hypothetical protein VFW44_15485 [Bryobacteraceae bacterium]|nr:hypothetical protein [Bryobacteraceae bacterium]